MNQNELEERIAWAKTMRLKFSPQRILHEDGTINQNYFRPQTIPVKSERQWTDEEDTKLRQGIQEFGVHSMEEIKTRYLPLWSDEELMKKAKELE